jgi:hypothetical protein
MYGSKHLEQNFFFFFCSQWFYGCWVPRTFSTQLFLWKINTILKK